MFGHFQSFGLENKSIWIVFRIEFDDDIRFCVAFPKSMFLLVFTNFFEFFRDLFVFVVFLEVPFFFPMPPPLS